MSKKKKVIKKFRGNGVRKVELTAKSMKFEHFFVQTLHSKIDVSHKKNVSIGRLFVTPPTFKVLSAPLNVYTVYIQLCIVYSV